MPGSIPETVSVLLVFPLRNDYSNKEHMRTWSSSCSKSLEH